MVVAAALEKDQPERAEQLRQLRRQMAAVSSRTAGQGSSDHRAQDVLPGVESLLPVPDSLAGVLPRGLPRGVVAVVSGARSPVVGMTAAVTAAGGHVAVVGLPDFGLLAAAEMGADLSRLAVIPSPGSDPVEVAAVLADGMDLVVLGLAGRSVPATRARAVMARVRQRGCALLVTQGQWQGASMRVEARVCGYEITAGPGDPNGVPAPGCGRISGVRVAARSRNRR